MVHKRQEPTANDGTKISDLAPPPSKRLRRDRSSMGLPVIDSMPVGAAIQNITTDTFNSPGSNSDINQGIKGHGRTFSSSTEDVSLHRIPASGVTLETACQKEVLRTAAEFDSTKIGKLNGKPGLRKAIDSPAVVQSPSSPGTSGISKSPNITQTSVSSQSPRMHRLSAKSGVSDSPTKGTSVTPRKPQAPLKTRSSSGRAGVPGQEGAVEDDDDGLMQTKGNIKIKRALMDESSNLDDQVFEDASLDVPHNHLRLQLPNDFELVPQPQDSGRPVWLDDVLMNKKKELFLVTLPRNFNKKDLLNKDISIIDGSSSLLKTSTKQSKRVVADHYEAKVQRLPEETSRISVLYRCQDGFVSGPVTRSLTVRRVIHTPSLSEPPRSNTALEVRRSWDIQPITGEHAEVANQSGHSGDSALRLRRVAIGSGPPVVNCGYSEMRKKKKRKKVKEEAIQETAPVVTCGYSEMKKNKKRKKVTEEDIQEQMLIEKKKKKKKKQKSE